MIYPLGSTVIVEHIDSGKQEFLRGHTDTVTCVAVSKPRPCDSPFSKARPSDRNAGAYIASGQVTHMGFKVNNFNSGFGIMMIRVKLQPKSLNMQL